jgi:hypothetical protein
VHAHSHSLVYMKKLARENYARMRGFLLADDNDGGEQKQNTLHHTRKLRKNLHKSEQ